MAPLSPRTMDRIRGAVEEIARPLDLSVERVEFVREAGNRYLRITVSRPGGIDIRDCERLHRPLSKKLDEMDPIKEAYFLEVCSPGVETPADEDPRGPGRPADPGPDPLMGGTA